MTLCSLFIFVFKCSVFIFASYLLPYVLLSYDGVLTIWSFNDKESNFSVSLFCAMYNIQLFIRVITICSNVSICQILIRMNTKVWRAHEMNTFVTKVYLNMNSDLTVWTVARNCTFILYVIWVIKISFGTVLLPVVLRYNN